MGVQIRKMIPHKYDLVGGLLAILLALAFFLPVTNEEVLFDSSTYLRVTQNLVETHQLIIMSHFLYPLLVGMLKVILNLDYWSAGEVVVVFFEAMLVLLLYIFIRLVGGKPRSLVVSLLHALLAWSLLVVVQVSLLFFLDQHLYFGYIGINVYHNATMALLKPLALLLFWAALQVYHSHTKSVLLILLCAFLTLLTALAKPSFIVDLLPVLGLFTLYRLVKKQSINWWLLVFGIGLPMLLSLAWQYWFTYLPSSSSTEGDWQVVIAPFAVYRAWSDWLFPKFILSILFPLGVGILYFRDMIRELELPLAWGVFLFGASYGYLFAEQGVRFTHGNFVWSAQIGLFILFVYSTLFLLKKVPFGNGRDPGQVKSPAWKFWLSAGLYALHLAGGLVWYLNHLGIYGDPYRWW